MNQLELLIRRQHGMVARRQLNQHAVDADTVRNQTAAGRWVVRTPRVVSTTTGPMSWPQWLWLGVLHAGPRSMLGGLTAAAQHGLRGWGRNEVTVVVDDELSFEPVDGIDFFRSRRPFDLLRSTRGGLPACALEPAILLHAGYEAPTLRVAHGLLAAAVQQRLTTAPRLLQWVEQLRPLRRAASFRHTLEQIAGGAHSAAELDVARMCRRFGMAAPSRQRARLDRHGKRRWTDCEWDLPGGGVAILEVDGSFHLEVAQWTDDLKRTRRLTTRGRIVLRCTAFEIRHEADQVAADLIALGVPARRPPGRVPHDAA